MPIVAHDTTLQKCWVLIRRIRGTARWCCFSVTVSYEIDYISRAAIFLFSVGRATAVPWRATRRQSRLGEPGQKKVNDQLRFCRCMCKSTPSTSPPSAVTTPTTDPPPTLTPNSYRSYYLSGFLTLQTAIDRFMFSRALPEGSKNSGEGEEEEIQNGFKCVPPEVIGVPFPTAAYDQNLFYKAVGYLLGLAMAMVSRPAGDPARMRGTSPLL